MTSDVYFAEGLIKAWYEHDRNTLVIRMSHFNIGDHREPSLQCYLEALRKFEPKAIIIDSLNARGMFMPGDVEFLKTRTFPSVKETKTDTFICVFPKNPIASVAAKSWLNLGEQFGFRSVIVPNLEKAYKYLG